MIVVDFHAEATSEKVALARYLDGRVTAVLGTHTHVQTNDARVLPGGTAAITDAGMTGPHDSVIGVSGRGRDPPHAHRDARALRAGRRRRADRGRRSSSAAPTAARRRCERRCASSRPERSASASTTRSADEQQVAQRARATTRRVEVEREVPVAVREPELRQRRARRRAARSPRGRAGRGRAARAGRARSGTAARAPCRTRRTRRPPRPQ